MDDKTRIPLFAALGTLPFIVGAILWLSNVDAKATESLEMVKAQDPRLWKIEKSLIRIETKLGTKPEKEE